MLGDVLVGKDAPVDLGMQRLHAAAQDLGEAGDVTDGRHGQTGGLQGLHGPAGGDQLHAVLRQEGGKFHQSGFVRHAQDGAADRKHIHTDSPWLMLALLPQAILPEKRSVRNAALAAGTTCRYAGGGGPMSIRLVSWNVNGLRAVSAKPEWRWFAENTCDVIGLQETKAMPEQLKPEVANPEGWEAHWASSVVKKGYSGVAVFSRIKPLAVRCELPQPEWQGEGRILHLEFEKFHFFNGYFPNGGAEELDENGKPIPGRFKRVPYKMGFFDAFTAYAEECRKSKPIVVCGDFNIAHKAIDLARPKQNEKNTGFLPEERAFLDRFTALGYVDTFRHVHGDVEGRYSWWSYKMRAREKNVGWRIDYFFVSEELKPYIRDAWIEDDVYGSDHCPVGLELDI